MLPFNQQFARMAIFSFLLLAGVQSVFAKNYADSTEILEAQFKKYVDSINATITYTSGTVELPTTNAKLNLTSKFKFLDAKQSRFVLEELWGNLPDPEILGMVFPVDSDPFTRGSYVFVITYDKIGYVKDKDAEDIDYDEILEGMKKDQVEANRQRTEAGLATMNLVGWAAKPYYDKKNNTLHWAKDLKVEGSDENTLNYNIMLLGRKGILQMNAIASVNDLATVQASIPEVLKMPEFVSGSAYKDFDPDVDEVAAWTIGGLVAGKVLAKAGFFVLLLKFWKVIALAFVALGGFIMKFFKRKKEEQACPVDDYASTANTIGENTEEPLAIADPNAPEISDASATPETEEKKS